MATDVGARSGSHTGTGQERQGLSSMTPASTGRTGDGYQGRGIPPRPEQSPGRRPGPEVPRQRPPQDRRGGPAAGEQWDDYAVAPRPPLPPRPPRGAVRPQQAIEAPRRDPQGGPAEPGRRAARPADPYGTPSGAPGTQGGVNRGPAGRDPRLDSSFGSRDVAETHIPRGTRRRPVTVAPGFDVADDTALRQSAPPRPRLPRGNDIIGGAGPRPDAGPRAPYSGDRPTGNSYGDRPGGGRRARRRDDDGLSDSYGERPTEFDTDDWDDDGFDDREPEAGRGHRSGGSSRRSRRRERLERMTPEQRRRRKAVRRSVAGCLAVFLAWLGFSLGGALLADGNMSTQARVAEWGRAHYLGWAVTWMENQQYNLHPPKTGGTLSPDDLKALTPPTSTPSLAKDEHVLKPLQPFLPDPVPGEGVWDPAVVVNGVPIIQTAKLRADAQHTSYLSAVAWIDQKHAKFVLHPGSQQPGTAGYGETDHITDDQKKNLIATWNGAFLLNPNDAHGGFYLNGKTYGNLVDGQAAEVFKKDGSISVGQWGRDFQLTPDVVGVRQNLVLLVDNGQINPTVDSSDINLWGRTVKNANYVWRSGVGITADGNIVYAMGPTLSVRTLGELLQRAGAVRAMELDINMEWVSFMTYDGSKDPANPVPTKLLDAFKRTGQRYFSTEERDFVAVYSR